MIDTQRAPAEAYGAREPRATFGRALRRFRRRAGLTQEALAERAGYSAPYVGMLERGERAPLPSTADVLATALNLSAEERALLQAARRHVDEVNTDPSGQGPDALLVGRAAEVALLERHLAGDGPPILLLTGDPGIGKSRLLDEAARRGARHGWTVLHGGCRRRRGDDDSYAPILEALERHLRRPRRAARRSSLRGCAWLARLLPEVVQAGVEPPPAGTLSPERERRLVFMAVTRFLGNVAGAAGTLLALDDLQWAGPDALDLLVTLARAGDDLDMPLRVVAAYRQTEMLPDDPLSTALADLVHARLVAQHTVPPLEPEEARQLLETLLQDRPAPDDLGQIARRSGGVPFFVVSYAQEMRAGVGATADQELPWSLKHSIRQRVAALPDAAQDLLQLAAVIGTDAQRPLLAGVLARPEPVLVNAVEAACRARLLEERGACYRFTHDVIRDVIEADLSALRRALLHRRVAEALERLDSGAAVEALAYHFECADLPDRALPYLERAGDRAYERLAYGTAAEQYRALAQRLERTGRAGDAARAQERTGLALMAMGRHAAAIGALEEATTALQHLGDLDGVVRVLARLGQAHMRRGTTADGIARLRDALATPELAGAARGLAPLHATLAELYFVSGRYGEQIAAARRAAAAARADGDERTLAVATGRHGVALLLLGRADEAVPLLEEAARLAEAVGDLDSLCRALTNLGVIHFMRGEFARARPYRERALQMARRQGDPFSLLRTLANRGEGALYAGEWARARADFDEALRQAAQIDETGAAAYPLLDRALLCLVEGNWTEIERQVAEARTLAERSGDLQALRWATGLQAEHDILRGDPARAVACLTPLRDRPGMEETDVTYLLPTLAWALLESGDPQVASDVAAHAVERARAQRNLVILVDALRVHALVCARTGRATLAAAGAEEGLAFARAMPYPYAEARLLHLYATGIAAPEADGDAAARARLEAALAIYERLGARMDAARARRDLAALPYTRRLLDVGIVISTRQWARVEATLPVHQRRGRPRADDARMLAAILYVRHTGCGWANLPGVFGDGATAHRRFQQWRTSGVWERIASVVSPE